MLARKALAGTAGAPKVYVEDVFSTYLYKGNGSTQTITNNIDLSTKGGLVWIKRRPTAVDHALFDTERGATQELVSNSPSIQTTQADGLTSFSSTGFDVGSGTRVNFLDSTFVSWTFRKQPKFFDVVTWTGNGANYRTISHLLGSTPGMVIVKSTSASGAWAVWHRSADPNNLILNSTSAPISGQYSIQDVTSSNFSVADSTFYGFSQSIPVNDNGQTYVAYLFAHNAGGFGDAGSDNVISCGSFTTNGSGVASVSLGYEPQWVLVKRTDSTSDWFMIDNMRGWTAEPSNTVAMLRANLSSAENTASFTGWSINATGFGWSAGAASATYIYIAIRRGPMKTPTTGTSVYTPDAGTNGTNGGIVTTNFPVDLAMTAYRSLGGVAKTNDRLRGFGIVNSAGVTPALITSGTDSESSYSGSNPVFYNAWNTTITRGSNGANPGGDGIITWFFRRAPGFFDVVCYTGTGGNMTLNHNLGVPPELMIVKKRSAAGGWTTYAAPLGNTSNLNLNTTDAVNGTNAWQSTTPTSTVFYIDGSIPPLGSSGDTFVAYLFASLSGVSKIGTYTGNGSSVTVTTNFQPRFILVKRTDSTGDWIVSDSARGLVAGDDPYLELNTIDAEVTNEDWVDITSTSFTVNQTTNNANVNTGTYLYLAIA